MADLVPARAGDSLPVFAPAEVDSARRYRDASRAPGTRAKYAGDWAAFSIWCQARGHASLPSHPGTVAVYLSALADRKLAPSTVGRILAAIGYHHRLVGLVAPHNGEGGAVIADVVAGIRRSHATPPRRKAAADSYVVHAVLRAITGDTLADLRDRALVAFGMASALRRSELVALTMADLQPGPDGLRVRVVRSKTDQEGRGVVVAIPDGRRLKPLTHLNAWLERANINDGLVFRSLVNGRVGSALTDQSVSLVVKRRVRAAGYDPADFAAHSLRAGFLTSAAAAGASIWKMREVSRHKSVQVLSDYVRDSDLLRDHAGKDFL